MWSRRDSQSRWEWGHLSCQSPPRPSPYIILEQTKSPRTGPGSAGTESWRESSVSLVGGYLSLEHLHSIPGLKLALALTSHLGQSLLMQVCAQGPQVDLALSWCCVRCPQCFHPPARTGSWTSLLRRVVSWLHRNSLLLEQQIQSCQCYAWTHLKLITLGNILEPKTATGRISPSEGLVSPSEG